ncbi:ABC transporter AbcH.1 [Allomyces javanicus]|nr:ABC transporter AbcH.1 [Allomyces javanicus]
MDHIELNIRDDVLPTMTEASQSADTRRAAADNGARLAASTSGPAADPSRQGRAAVHDASPAPNTVVELNNIHKTYLLGVEGVPALRGVSLTVAKGEWVAVYGTSGGGKTSLLNIIGTIDKPTKGELSICGTVINANTTDDTLAALRLHKLGFVFQAFNLLSSMTARENVELPMTLQGLHSAAQRRDLATRALNRVGLGHRLDHFPAQLSGGEQQRVTIARALANQPEILLADEPTGDLDSANTDRVMDLLYRLNAEQKMTVIMVTHDPALKHYCSRVVYMRDGRVARQETVDPAARARALAELATKLNKTPVAASSPNPAPGPAAIRPTAMTERRRPSAYATCSAAALVAASEWRQRVVPVVHLGPGVANGSHGTTAGATACTKGKSKLSGMLLGRVAVKRTAVVTGVL